MKAIREKIFEFMNKGKFIRDSIPKRVKDYIPARYYVIVNVEDRPGILGELTKIIGENNLNIKEIEIMHSRDTEGGAVKIGFEGETEKEKAFEILKENGFSLTNSREDS